MNHSKRWLSISALTVPLIVLLGFSLCFNALAQDEPWVEEAKSLPLRIITLRVAADEEFRRRDDWEKAIRTHIKAVSEVFEKNFHIRFQIADIVPWNSTHRAPDIKAMLTELATDVQGGDAEIVLGISGQLPQTFRKLKEAGGAKPLASTALVLLVEDVAEFYPTIIAHELCHLFGAWHVADQGSVMHKSPKTLTFDKQTAKVIRLMRGFDFGQGVIGIDEETKRILLTTFKKSHAARRENPLTTAYTNQGGKLVEQGKYEEGIEAIREALRFDPNFAEARQNLYAAYTNQGGKLVEQGKYNEAIESLREALRINPNQAEARQNLIAAYTNQGGKLVEQGKYNEAIESLREALRIDPNFAEARQNLYAAYTNQGGKLVEQGKYNEAIESLREALRINPNQAEARRNLAIAINYEIADLMNNGKYYEAWKTVHKGQQLGVNVDRRTLQFLRTMMPEPERHQALGE